MCFFKLIKFFLPVIIIGVVVYFVFFHKTSDGTEAICALNNLV